MGNHDPRYPKTDKHVLFSYTCKDGSEVPADAFRIGGSTVILKAFQELRATGPSVEACIASMLDYAMRSVRRSSWMMREPGDACAFIRQLAFIAEEGILDVGRLLPDLDFVRICEGASEKSIGQMSAALRRCGIHVNLWRRRR